MAPAITDDAGMSHTRRTAPRPPWRYRARLNVRGRRVAGVVLVLVGVAAARAAAAPPPVPMTDVVTARVTLTPAAAVGADDVGLLRVPTMYVPDDAATDIGAVVGRTPAAAVTPGTILTAPDLLDADQADGIRLVPVQVADAALATLLSPGQVVDIYDAVNASERPGVDQAPPPALDAISVAAVAPRPPDGLSVVLRVPADRATRLLAIAAQGPVAIAIRGSHGPR